MGWGSTLCASVDGSVRLSSWNPAAAAPSQTVATCAQQQRKTCRQQALNRARLHPSSWATGGKKTTCLHDVKNDQDMKQHRCKHRKDPTLCFRFSKPLDPAFPMNTVFAGKPVEAATTRIRSSSGRRHSSHKRKNVITSGGERNLF